MYVRIKMNIALNTKSEEPKNVDMFTLIAGHKLKIIMGSSEDFHTEIKNKTKERSTMTRYNAIVHSQKFQNQLTATNIKKLTKAPCSASGGFIFTPAIVT